MIAKNTPSVPFFGLTPTVTSFLRNKHILFKSIAKEASAFFPDQEPLAFQKRIVDFLADREKAGELPQAIFFIKNLMKLKQHVNADGSKIHGTTRIFMNAEDAIEKGDYVSGYYFEAISALSLIDNDYDIREFSVRRFRDIDGVSREIDIIAENHSGATLFIDANSSIASMLEHNNRNGQVLAFTKIAEEQNAIPVAIIRTRDPVLDSKGNCSGYKELRISLYRKAEAAELMTVSKGLQIWDTDCNPLVDLNSFNLN